MFGALSSNPLGAENPLTTGSLEFTCLEFGSPSDARTENQMVNNGSSVSAGFAAGAVNQNAGEVRNRNIWRPKTILEPRSFRLAPDLPITSEVEMLFAFASNPGPSTALPGYETVVSHLTTDVTELWRNRGNPAGSRNYAYPAQAAAFLRLWATPAQGGTRGPVIPCCTNLGEVWRNVGYAWRTTRTRRSSPDQGASARPSRREIQMAALVRAIKAAPCAPRPWKNDSRKQSAGA